MAGAAPRRRALRDVVCGVALGVGCIVTAWLLRAHGVARTLDATGQFAAAVSTWLACRRTARDDRGALRADTGRTWTLAGRAALWWAIGEALLAVQDVVFHSTARPAVGDAAFVFAVAYALRAPIAFPSARVRAAARTRVVLDGSIVASSVLFLFWMLVVQPYLAPSAPLSQLAPELVYPMLDLVVIAVVLGTLAASSGEHAVSLGLSAFGLMVLAGTNLAEGCMAVVGNDTIGVTPVDLGFVAGLGLVGLGAAVDGAIRSRRLVERVAATQRVVPYVPLPFVLVVIWRCHDELTTGPMTVVFVLALLMVIRQTVMSADNNALLAEHREAMAALADSETRYRRIVEHAGEGIWVTDAAGITRMVNPRAVSMLGLEGRELVGQPTAQIFDSMLDDAGRDEVRRRMRERAQGDGATYEFRLRRPDGEVVHTLVSASPLYDADGDYEGSLTMFSDITSRKLLEEELVEQAHTDVLTGLGNRTVLAGVSQSALSRSGAALVYCDLDGFKAVNDSLGHSTGDELLREVARRLRASVRPGDIIVRLGGDEFAALLPGVVQPPDAQAVADRMLEALRDPFPIDGRRLYVGASIGIAILEPGGGIEQLLRDADIAMYAAKAEGRGRHRVYHADMHAAVTQRLALEQDLRGAIEADELQVWFQPVVRLADGVCVGAEALVRWEHPEHGLLRPDEFIPMAGESGLLPALERRVLAAATAAAASWPDQDGQPLTVAVNMAAQHITDGTIVRDVSSALDDAGLDATRLVVELTERSLLSGSLAAAAVSELHTLGCRVALDDFGTGYSSIAHLRDFPVDVVKLDRSFVAGMTSDLQVSRLVTAIVQLTRTLGISACAEGVETTAQARRLAAAGCETAQGFLYAPALPAATFADWLAARPALLDAAAAVAHAVPHPRVADVPVHASSTQP